MNRFSKVLKTLLVTFAMGVSCLAVPSAAVTPEVSTTTCDALPGVVIGDIPVGITRIRATIEIANGIGAVAVRNRLDAVAGWSSPSTKGSGRIAFEGDAADVAAALASLRVRGASAGPGNVTVMIAPAGASYLSSNGHFYAAIAGTYANWQAASSTALASTFNGMSGYLATVTSASEVEVLSTLGVGGWLGGSDAAKDGEWRWMAGPEAGQLFTFTNWAAGEPNNFFAGGENSLEMKANTGVWNDARDIEPLAYALVEYGGQTAPLMVPHTQSIDFQAVAGVGDIFDAAACDPVPTDIVTRMVSAGDSKTPAEIDLLGTPSVANPFSIDQANIWAEFEGPSKQIVRSPFFWFQDYTGALPRGEGVFRVRFKPTEAGQWTLRVSGVIRSLDLSKVVQPLSLTFAEASVPQIQVNGTGFSRGGKPFTPIGYNIAWSKQNSLADYDKWFKQAARNGANWARVWMASWGFGIEWKDTGLGDYSKRQDRAKKLDQVFALGAKYGININLVLLNHGAFSETTNSEWRDNPYNKLNGGPLNSPGEFVTSADAKKFWEQRLRYVVARWGAQSSLVSWEWWNEVDFTPMGASELQSWIRESDQLLRTLDAYNHPTTTSWSSGGSLRDWSNVDFASIHVYNDADPIATLGNLAPSMKTVLPGKPTIVAEMGSGAAGEDPTLDKTGLHMHNSQWAAVFAGFGSPAMYWWWDEYIDPLKLWGATKSLSVLIAGADLPSMTPRKIAGPKHTITQALVGSGRTLVWVRHSDYSRSARIKLLTAELIKALKENRKPRAVGVPTALAASFMVPVAAAGRYKVQLINVQTGAILKTSLVRSVGLKVKVTTPKFAGDIAVRLVVA